MSYRRNLGRMTRFLDSANLLLDINILLLEVVQTHQSYHIGSIGKQNSLAVIFATFSQEKITKTL